MKILLPLACGVAAVLAVVSGFLAAIFMFA